MLGPTIICVQNSVLLKQKLYAFRNATFPVYCKCVYKHIIISRSPLPSLTSASGMGGSFVHMRKLEWLLESVGGCAGGLWLFGSRFFRLGWCVLGRWGMLS